METGTNKDVHYLELACFYVLRLICLLSAMFSALRPLIHGSGCRALALFDPVENSKQDNGRWGDR
jgi:hypothetical protein